MSAVHVSGQPQTDQLAELRTLVLRRRHRVLLAAVPLTALFAAAFVYAVAAQLQSPQPHAFVTVAALAACAVVAISLTGVWLLHRAKRRDEWLRPSLATATSRDLQRQVAEAVYAGRPSALAFTRTLEVDHAERFDAQARFLVVAASLLTAAAVAMAIVSVHVAVQIFYSALSLVGLLASVKYAALVRRARRYLHTVEHLSD